MRIELPSGAEAELVTVEGATRGLVVFPDIFGLRPLFDEHVQRFARDWGVTTLALDPFRGLDSSADLEQRFAAVAALSDDAVRHDLEEAAHATQCAHVGMIGFCMGGMYCFKASTLACFDRIASFYGMITLPVPWQSVGHREPLHYLGAGGAAKVLAIIGTEDTWTPPADVDALEAVGTTVVRYVGAEHGFAHDTTRPAHRVDDAADAFERARQWLT